MAEGLCWCASEAKCPHGISTKLPGMWEDMEKVRCFDKIMILKVELISCFTDCR